MKSWTILLFFSCLISAPIRANTAYEFTDLEILSKQGPYAEFFEHIYDIRPAKRDEAWLKLARSTSEKYVRQLLERKKIDDETWQQLQEIAGQYYNKENDALSMAMASYGLALVRSCFQNKQFSECYQLAKEVLATKNEVQLAHDLGKLVHDHQLKSPHEKGHLVEKVWPFYAVMAKTTISEFYCDKDYFQDIVLSKINEEIQNKKATELKNTVFKLVHQDCWKKLASSIKDQLKQSHSEPELYRILMETDSLGPDEMITYSIIYLIQRPSQGSVLERSWSNLMKIKEDYTKRQEVLTQLKKLDPLPGKIFASSDDKRSLVIVKNLANFFPEYVDHYVQTCMKYYASEVDFPNGNPTMECNGLFDMAKKIDILPELVQKRYEQIRNFKL